MTALSDVDVYGMPVARLDHAGLSDVLFGALGAKRPQGGWLMTANLDILRQYVGDPELQRLWQGADLIVADGMPLVWAAALAGTPLPERIAGSDLSLSLIPGLAQRGHRLFLLGGDAGVAERAAQRLQARCPGLVVAGTHCPPFGFEHDPAEMDAIRSQLRAARPDIVYVALGAPKQDKLIASLKPEFPGVWWVGVGISLSFITGDVARAPAILQRLGLEWVHRLSQEPRRLAKRYLVDDLPFAIRLIAWALGRRWFGGRRARSQ